MKTFEKGNLSEAKVTSKLLDIGVNVLIPFGGGHRYDLVIERSGKFYRIQVKTGRIYNGQLVFNVCSNNKGYKRQSYHDDVEYIVVYCIENDMCCVIPIQETGKSEMKLRLITSGDNCGSHIRYAHDYLLCSSSFDN